VGWRKWRICPAVAQWWSKLMAEMNWFEFTSPPPVGLRVRYRKTFLTLEAVEPHQRKDGQPTHVLRWVTDDGRKCTSGLRAKCVCWAMQDFAAKRGQLAPGQGNALSGIDAKISNSKRMG
jgi:hypothetical protein